MTEGVPPGEKIATPFGSAEYVSLLLKRHNLTLPEFYPAPSTDMYTEEGIQRKMRDTLRARYILVPGGALGLQSPSKAQFEQQNGEALRRLLLFPVPYHLKREPLDANVELSHFLRRHYRFEPRPNGHYLGIRREPG